MNVILKTYFNLIFFLLKNKIDDEDDDITNFK